MFARVTMFDIDLIRIGREQALDRFKKMILPEMQKQDGYAGAYALLTPEGQGCILSLWASEEAVLKGEQSGYYDQQVAQFVSFYRSPPGRERYEVVLVDGVGDR